MHENQLKETACRQANKQLRQPASQKSRSPQVLGLASKAEIATGKKADQAVSEQETRHVCRKIGTYSQSTGMKGGNALYRVVRIWLACIYGWSISEAGKPHNYSIDTSMRLSGYPVFGIDESVDGLPAHSTEMCLLVSYL